MRFLQSLIFALLACGPAVAASAAAPADPSSTRGTGASEDVRRAQVAAATADALGALTRDVMAAPVAGDLSVEQFVRKGNGREVFAKTLRGAEQIGGTRWLDDQTCQVRMELPGDAVANALVQIAEAEPRASVLPASALSQRLDDLRGMTFAATGMSTSAIERLRPPPDQQAWRGVPDEAVRVAVNDARRGAARQVLEAVEPIELPGSDGKARLANVLTDPKVHEALEGWLMSRPVTSARFDDDLEVRVGVAADGESFWNELVSAAGDRKDLPFPPDDKARAELRQRVLDRVEPTVGRAVAKAGAVGDGAPNVMAVADIPRDPPRWVAEQVDARGSSRAVDGRLKTARAAEGVARDRLRERLEELPLSPRQTLGDAARRDPRLRDAVDRAIRGARPRKVNYLADGSAEVTFTLDLRDLWYEIAAR